MKSIYLKTAVTAVLMGVAAVAVAKGPPNKELGNNLSVPTIMIGGGFTNVICGSNEFSGHVAPSGDPVWYPYQMITDHDGNITELPEGYYFVQRKHVWQAPCKNTTDTTTYVDGAWGDNFSGDAKLMVGKPIRVELVLTEYSGAVQTGYVVEKLELEEPDRASDYGTWANPGADPGDPWYADETDMVPGVYGAGAWLTITNASGDVVVDEAATAEINAKGRVVYGYNLRVTAAGEYDITFVVPNVEFKSANHGGTFLEDTATIRIGVIPGGGGKPKKVK